MFYNNHYLALYFLCMQLYHQWSLQQMLLHNSDKDDPKNKKYQKIAAAAAAKAVFYYLAFLYTKPEERDLEF